MTATPESQESGETTIGFLGITASLKLGSEISYWAACKRPLTPLVIFRAVGNLIAQPDINKLGGPVAIFQLSSQAARKVTTVIAMMAMISINLGIFNLLPIPGLDGDKLVLNILEGLRGKPISQKKKASLL